MKALPLTLLAAGAVLLGGCSSILTSKAPAPVYYQIDYQTAPVECEHDFGKGVQVWDFSAASPFDRPEMVVVQGGGEVQYSETYQWVTSPGSMVAQHLANDLGSDRLFTIVTTSDSRLNPQLKLTGRVRQFAWKKQDGVSRAVLEVEVSLIDTGEARRVLYHDTYSLRSAAFQGEDSGLFARVMGDLVKRFSQRLRRDLCDAAAQPKKKAAAAS